MFLVGPALTLSNNAYNDLIIGVTIMLLAVIAPVGAFQQHLLRLETTPLAVADARRKSLVCSAFGGVVACVLTAVLTTPGWWLAGLTIGAIASSAPTLTASLHALTGSFRKSALLDATSGMFFVAITVPLVALHAAPGFWSVGFSAVWVTTAIISMTGPLAYRPIDHKQTVGRFLPVLRDARTLIAVGVAAAAFSRADYLALTMVANDSEAARYALASRVVGPVLIALGSLNNSLYVRQLQVRDDPGALRELTVRTSRRVGLLAVAVVPCSVAFVGLLGAASDSMEARQLLVPTFFLALATVPFAFALPFGFALHAQNRERVWLWILTAATFLNLLAILALGREGATAAAIVWLLTQVSVWAVVTLGVKPVGRAAPVAT